MIKTTKSNFEKFQNEGNSEQLSEQQRLLDPEAGRLTSRSLWALFTEIEYQPWLGRGDPEDI